MLQNGQPFFFGRYGDGYLECVYRLRQGGTRDGEQYTVDLAAELQSSWSHLQHIHEQGMPLVIADWQSAVFNSNFDGAYPEQYEQMMCGVRRSATFISYEAIMLDRQTKSLLDFYTAVKKDKRKKVVIAPHAWIGCGRMLDAVHLEIPMGNLWDFLPVISERLEALEPEVILYASGMCGTIPVIRYVANHPNTTSLNIGSSLDPIFRGKTRNRQIDQRAARTFFRPLL